MGIEFMPSAISPKSLEAEQRLVASEGPKLAGAFEPALVLAAG